MLLGLAPERRQQDIEHLVQELINPWMDACLAGTGNHENCSLREMGLSSGFWLPTRLIDVESSSNDTIRLVTTEDELPRDSQPKYMILSYCWGKGNEPAKTTRANLEERKRAIDTLVLPKTIQDAIHLTQLMGIRYLCVDALCIVQAHSEDYYLDDWYREAPKMGSYYSNSHCSISALSAADSNDGLFSERPGQKYPLKRCLVGVQGDCYIRAKIPRFEHDDMMAGNTLANQPLMQRAWYFQERLLAPRILHWATSALAWQCESVPKASEFDPEGSDDRILWRKGARLWGVSADDTPNLMRDSWARLVKRFSIMQLSFASDRLAAIHGIATTLATLRECRYFAGIFECGVPNGLLWKAKTWFEIRRKLSEFPSWSWASSNGDVSFVDSFEQSTVRLHPDSAQRFSSEPEIIDFGAADNEKRMLRIEAPLVSIDPGPESSALLNVSGQWIITCPNELKMEIIWDEYKATMAHSGDIQFVVLGHTRLATYPVAKRYAHGIVVQPRGDGYLRVGYVEITSPFETQFYDGCRTKIALF